MCLWKLWCPRPTVHLAQPQHLTVAQKDFLYSIIVHFATYVLQRFATMSSSFWTRLTYLVKIRAMSAEAGDLWKLCVKPATHDVYQYKCFLSPWSPTHVCWTQDVLKNVCAEIQTMVFLIEYALSYIHQVYMYIQYYRDECFNSWPIRLSCILFLGKKSA